MVKILVIILLFYLAAPLQSRASQEDSLRMQILLNQQMLADLHLDINLIDDLEVIPGGYLLLSTTHQLYVLGWGGMEPYMKMVSGEMSSMALTHDSMMMVVRGSELCTFDSLGGIHRLFQLPGTGMGITAGKACMYLYHRTPPRDKYSLFALATGAEYTKLFDLPSPLTAVCERGNELLFATENALFAYEGKKDEARKLAVLPRGEKIVSVATDPATSRVYFSSAKAIYTMADTSILTLTNSVGGTLGFVNGGLIVLDNINKLVIGFVGLEPHIQAKLHPEPVVSQPPAPEVKEPPKPTVLTNSTIIDLVKSKIADDVIVKLIESSPVNFDLSAEGIGSLTSQGVSAILLAAMIKASQLK